MHIHMATNRSMFTIGGSHIWGERLKFSFMNWLFLSISTDKALIDPSVTQVSHYQSTVNSST